MATHDGDDVGNFLELLPEKLLDAPWNSSEALNKNWTVRKKRFYNNSFYNNSAYVLIHI